MQEVIARRPLTIGYGSALLGVVLFQPQVLMLFHSRDKIQLEIDLNGAPDTIRTCDLCLRRATLYPAELRARREMLISSKPI